MAPVRAGRTAAISRRAGHGSRCMACACVLEAAKRLRCACSASSSQHVCFLEALVNSQGLWSSLFITKAVSERCCEKKEGKRKPCWSLLLQEVCLQEYAASLDVPHLETQVLIHRAFRLVGHKSKVAARRGAAAHNICPLARQVELSPIQQLLPDEMMALVLSHLPSLYALGAVACVCRGWRDAAQNPALWRTACARTFPELQHDALTRLVRDSHRCAARRGRAPPLQPV